MTATDDRWISLGDGLCRVPERLLLAHARGEVLFITGAGTSKPAGLPDFRSLVLKVYERADAAVHSILRSVPPQVCNLWEVPASALTDKQNAEIKRFIQGDYDVVLGMLEWRIDGPSSHTNSVRKHIVDILESSSNRPAAIHRALIKLADRGSTSTIFTTNFDRLLEKAIDGRSGRLGSYALGAIPRPTRKEEFTGVLHIRGVLPASKRYIADIVVTDQDFGEFYLRRRIIPDLIYDAARLFNLVLVGYSANDAPTDCRGRWEIGRDRKMSADCVVGLVFEC